MKRTYTGLLALLLTASLCTSCSSKKNDDANKEEEIQEMEVEDEFDVDLKDGEAGAGF